MSIRIYRIRSLPVGLARTLASANDGSVMDRLKMMHGSDWFLRLDKQVIGGTWVLCT